MGTARRVLIVEDDPMIALELEGLMQEAAPAADVLTCESLAKARTAIAEGVAFAVLDIDVADGRTFPLADCLDRRRVPFLFVSAASRAELPAPHAQRRFVAKPFDPEELGKVLRCAVAGLA